MHQQVRCSIRKTLREGSRGRVDDESLVEILSLLEGISLQSAGRANSDRADGGEFVFSVQHEDGDDTADDKACKILQDDGYDAEVYQVRDFKLVHKGGSLLKCIRDLEKELKEPVIEVFVGAAGSDDKVPVQLVTRKMLNRPPDDGRSHP